MTGRRVPKEGEIREIFRTAYNGHPNVMTPDIIEFGHTLRGAFLFEISSGRGLTTDKVYGVTVLGPCPWPDKPAVLWQGRGYCKSHLSTCFPTYAQAKEYARQLGRVP